MTAPCSAVGSGTSQDTPGSSTISCTHVSATRAALLRSACSRSRSRSRSRATAAGHRASSSARAASSSGAAVRPR
ncbi:hypothetical protein [Kitasatospora sp. NPDC059827]|uniref:hypothetical protein n=1 Tax=Kitasatospora sp. NPDC059827 TaxID=3346964 RepID=UPI0036680011